jgi:carbonic anhydrase/acetyltransferase-like protein (isoleucine patch superfamily)
VKIYIDVPNLTIGYYTTIHKNTTIHGYKPCSIGHKLLDWYRIRLFDSIGGATLGNNVGIGAYSQLWSHISSGCAGRLQME